MSKHDGHFLSMFNVVLGMLVGIGITVALFGVARLTARPVEGGLAVADSQVAERIAPVGRVAVAGMDNSAIAIAPTSAGGAGITTALPVPKSAEETYQAVCSACHAAGVAGAPKMGDHGAWRPRVAEGKAMLYDHALKGFTGKAGVMPAKGGRADLPDALVRETVDYLVKASQ